MELKLPQAVQIALDALCSAGYSAYTVGGCVRDFLRGVPPHDYDMTTSALPEQMQEVFADFHTVPTGLAHGTLTVLIDGMPLEITTYRIDGAYTDRRRPDRVTFTAELCEDLRRRDFTVNAMAYHPVEGVIDPFGGMADLSARILRAVGEPAERFDEDALRILRALRFSAVLGYTIEPQTDAAARALAPTLTAVSPERVREELVKLLCGANASAVLEAYAPILQVVAPEGSTPSYLAALPAEPLFRVAAYFASAGPEAADAALRRLRFDNATRAEAVALIRLAGEAIPVDTVALKRLLCREGEARVARLFSYCEARGDAVAQAYAAFCAIREEGACYTLRDLKINGEGLKALGVPKGKACGAMLAACLDAVIEGRVANTEQALTAYVRQRL